MIRLDNDSRVAERQVVAILFLLVAFGYIDGDFDESERAFVDRYIGRLIEVVVSDVDHPIQRDEWTRRYRQRFDRSSDKIDLFVESLLTEPLAEDETREDFVHGRLKLRAFEIFEHFDAEMQHKLFQAVEELIAADGHVHPAEARFRDEVKDLLRVPLPKPEELEALIPSTLQIREEVELVPRAAGHPILDRLEHPYHPKEELREKQAQTDRDLIERAISKLWEQRRGGSGRLSGVANVQEYEPTSFLDEFVYVVRPDPKKEYELIVLGDLHGCYSCLKAALMQADFFTKVDAFKNDPTLPEPKLVLLGDYIDRGIYGLEGVLRAALALYLRYPEHVCLIRGNHEWYLEREGTVMSGVRPSEAISHWIEVFDADHFRHYVRLFDNLPAMLLFDRTLFVHGGIPRDDTMDGYEDLSFLNDPYVRFQMMWSDPSEADHVPVALQKEGARFAFGVGQLRRFLSMLGASTLVRGHEKIGNGFEVSMDDGFVKLLTVFSAGGLHNDDLPPRSPYRKVRPMAATFRYRAGELSVTPWEIAYEPFNAPERNGFMR